MNCCYDPWRERKIWLAIRRSEPRGLRGWLRALRRYLWYTSHVIH